MRGEEACLFLVNIDGHQAVVPRGLIIDSYILADQGKACLGKCL